MWVPAESGLRLCRGCLLIEKQCIRERAAQSLPSDVEFLGFDGAVRSDEVKRALGRNFRGRVNAPNNRGHLMPRRDERCEHS